MDGAFAVVKKLPLPSAAQAFLDQTTQSAA
jgi:hypothetical protein